jgi:predicted ATPase
MLTRIYIDNFRCFVNFEYRPAQKQLILGSNGAGKSSLLDALLFLRRVVVLGHDLEKRGILSERTLWANQPNQIFELEVVLDEVIYIYRLVIDAHGDPPQARILSESVKFAEKPIFEFQAGEVHLFDDHFHHKVAYPFGWHRSALATVVEMKDNRKLIRFKRWFNNLLCFQINPFQMEPRAEREDTYPYRDLSNFASWYRHLVQSAPSENVKMLDSLRAVIDDFSFLKLERTGENTRELVAEFVREDGTAIKLGLNKLSDGQRCLIALYTILHFVLIKGDTVILDEPENFVSLREIQPWLNAVSDEIENGKGQILVISHHPELMNQWAPDFGVQFVREGMGPVRVKRFSREGYSSLLPSEIVARGWENE